MTTAPLHRIEEARARYAPAHVRWLFIAEAPPRSPERFFYYGNVPTGDSLFLTLMRTLYPQDYAALDAAVLRAQKPAILSRFRDEGCFLEDASSAPIQGSPSSKKRALRAALPSLLERLEPLRENHPKVVLISATVYEVSSAALKRAQWNVLNEEAVPFPGSGQQARFRDIVARLLLANGWSA